MSEDMDKQPKLAHKVIDVVNRAKKLICVTLLRYNVDERESSYAQLRLFTRRKEGEYFQQIIHVNYEKEFNHLLVVITSVYDKVTANKPIHNVL